MNLFNDLTINSITEKEMLNRLLESIGDIIAKNNDQGLELDFDLWAETVFGEITGYGQEEGFDIIPQAFIKAFSSGDQSGD